MSITQTPSKMAQGLAGLILLALCGCASKIEPLNSVYPYSKLAGKNYSLLSDCYVFRMRDSRGDLPYVLSYRDNPRVPTPVDRAHVGESNDSGDVLGLVPAGTIFRVNSIQRISIPLSDNASWRYVYDISFVGKEISAWPHLDAYYLTDWIYNDPRFYQDIARPARSEAWKGMATSGQIH